jgi:hypothetical protein
MAMVEPGDVVIDATGTRSLLRDHLAPGADGADPEANTLSFLVEHALVITFRYGQTYVCNEFCEYDKTVENPRAGQARRRRRRRGAHGDRLRPPAPEAADPLLTA